MSKKSDYFDIQAKAGERTVADIYIYDQIGEFWGEGVGAKRFAEELNALGKLDAINVFINSPGGSVFEGVAIYNTLKRNSARVLTQIDGIAASIASVIAMAGDTIHIAENGLIMIHDPWVYAMGNSRDLREQADVLDKVGKTLIDTYVSRTGMDADEVAKLMAAETWMNADEAIASGFADERSAPAKIAAKFDPSAFNFKNLPKELKPEPPEPVEPAVTDDSRPTAAQIKTEIANLEHFLSKSRKAHNHPLAK